MPPHTEHAAEPATTDPRRGPRRRGEALEQAILTATVEELTEVGYPALTVDRVAARARTSKAAIYRRWSGLPQLVADACARHQMADIEVPDTGAYRTDVLAVLREMGARITGPFGSVIRTVVSEIARSPEFAALAEAQFDVAEQIMTTLLERGIERGEVDPRVRGTRRVTVATDLIIRHLLMTPDPDVDAVIVDIVDDIHLPLVLRADGESGGTA
ncbi:MULTISPECIES: TetR-like C-terminal domain-containing protein [Amycolatopsis]|uniref:DNA-binding transcriptional regulator, AcrR family n=2 Tax=Amycolatopsis TaxID=1813 RepID=A0A1I3VRP1_9PSEU|nr:TetR/AcrR family transcriptional regulator [Amycolatopsis sacchari]SFJ96831.1 DNA-binding transcriptional regulator, AcrR family [Amycolatopsis sacchari]